MVARGCDILKRAKAHGGVLASPPDGASRTGAESARFLGGDGMTATDARPIDLLDPYLYSGDPWPVYRDVNGIVGVSRHADVSEVERNTELYSSASGSRPFIQMSESMINKDDPFHAQQRKLVSSRFRLAALARHEDHVRRVVTELI